jgi:hypothetical protein
LSMRGDVPNACIEDGSADRPHLSGANSRCYPELRLR